MQSGRRISTVAIVAALVGIAALATAAVMFVSGEAQLERLGLLVALFGTIIPGLVASLRSDQAASSSHAAAENTNGTLDARIAAAVQDAIAHTIQVRRTGDSAVVEPVAEGLGGPVPMPDPDPRYVEGEATG